MRLAKRIAVVLIFLIGAGDPGAGLYERARKEFYALRKKKFARTQLVSLAEKFAHVQDVAPSSYRADDALYMAGTLYLEAFDRWGNENDLKKGIKYLEKLWTFYPRSRYADDALFLCAESYRVRLHQVEKALRYYRKILEKYPSGDQAPRARYWVDHLKVKKRTVGFRTSAVTLWSYSDYARMVVKTGERVKYFYNRLPGGPGGALSRIYIDVEPAELKGASRFEKSLKKGLVARLRIAQFTEKRVRLVLDLRSENVSFRVFHFDEPFRIVVDIFAEEEVDIASLLEPFLEEKKREPQRRRERKKPQQRRKPEPERRFAVRQPVVVIDPGHGGKDPGAIGKYGTKEKDVTLKLAILVKKKLEKRGVKVILTRSKDVYVPLEKRTAIANSVKADIFISIHANASKSRRARGVEVYYFEKTSDRDVLRLAAQENNVRSLRDLSEVQYILFDMVAKYKARLSAVLAKYVHKGTLIKIKKFTRTRDLGVKPGPFFVLKNAVMPSILVETSFISNPEEEKLLRDPRYVDAIADGIVEGIIKFMREQQKISI